MKIKPSSGGEEIHLRRLREEIRGGSDRVQEEARCAPCHALPRRGGQLPKVGEISTLPAISTINILTELFPLKLQMDISGKKRDELRAIMEEHGFKMKEEEADDTPQGHDEV